MILLTNSLVLENLIEFLCRESQFEEKIKIEKAYLDQIYSLSLSGVQSIIIHRESGFITDYELQIYIKLLQDNGIDTAAFDYIKVGDDILTAQKSIQSAMYESVLNSLEIMILTINQLRDELNDFSFKPPEPLKFERPSFCVWLAFAYDLCHVLRENFTSTLFGEKEFDLNLFQKKVLDASHKVVIKIVQEDRDYALTEILKFIDASQAHLANSKAL